MQYNPELSDEIRAALSDGKNVPYKPVQAWPQLRTCLVGVAVAVTMRLVDIARRLACIPMHVKAYPIPNRTDVFYLIIKSPTVSSKFNQH